MTALKRMESPRLYVPADVVENLPTKLHSPYLVEMAERVVAAADGVVRVKPLAEGVSASWQHGTRQIDSQLGCLTTAWVLTRDPRYRRAALKHLAGLTQWNQISCEANSATPADADMMFCLSYGELSATVGLMYDLFRPDLADGERQIFMAFLDKFLMRAAVKAVESAPWWANKEWSNWNGVCAGGMGIMALAFHGDHPDAEKLLPFVDGSLDEYFKSFIKNGGGCHEGTGYWNYGMNYAMRYVLSWEHCVGRKHAALQIRELRQSLFFPLDFTGITFGDNDGWGPTCFYFLLAKRLNEPQAALNAAAYLLGEAKASRKAVAGRVETGELLFASNAIPSAAEMEALKASHEQQKVPVARVYKGMDWAALADDEAFPQLRLALRGGSSTIAGHGMLDLLSFRCRVNGALMITDQQDGPYMQSTFTKRGTELYGRSAASKSTLFIDGLGCDGNVTCDKTEVVKGDGLLGIRIDASHIYLPRWKDKFVGRLVLLVDNRYWLVIDHMLGSDAVDKHWMESRFHTLAEATQGRNAVALKSGKERLQMTFAALGQGMLQQSLGMPSTPNVPRTTIFRWLGKACLADNLHVVALNPGSQRLRLAVSNSKANRYAIDIKEPGGQARRIVLNTQLRLR